MESSVSSLNIVFLDFFKDIEGNLEEILDSPMLKILCEPIIDLTLIFSDIDNSKEVNTFIKNSGLPQKKIDDLERIFEDPFQTSFSYGYKNKEFVFIQLERSSPLLKPTHRNGLTGLIFHEILHSIQRQRGLEVRLRNSLVFSLDFFTQLASIMPPESFKQEELVTFLKQISQIALFSLKDIFVNVEMMKRGLSNPLLDFYSVELRLEESDQTTPPILDIPFQKGEIKIKDLDKFAKAFNYTISLIPVWLPTMVLQEDSIDYTPSRKLKHFIFQKYYINPSLITREMWHIENIFLTSFSFSKNFHVKWFGAIFNLALEYLLGEDFVFYHLSKATELVEAIYEGQEDPERKRLAMVPILKAAYVHKREYPAGIQQKNVEDLDAAMKRYTIDQEEIVELEETLDELIQTKDSHFGHFFENLLQLSIMILARDFRQDVFHGHQTPIKDFGRAILTLLQAINYLGDQCDEEYYHSVRLTVKRLLRSDNVFKQKHLAIHLEIISKEAIFASDTDATSAEVEELLYNFDFFEIPLNNTFIEMGISFINNIKTVLRKVPITDSEFPLLASQFISILLSDKELSIEEMDQINMILVSSLIATSGVPFTMIQPVLEQFVTSSHPLQTENDE
ncbi:MAG: hypothetical protein JSU57_04680 [Candidatus Heimdallarchaeota archaeon]|nr:MAG: hypothetical protein JSU57_04680 [Candidatus Heimdallarchaeota archaeon]